MTSPSWELYRSFLAVVRTGSLSAAARALDVTQPTISRHIVELEAKLGRGALFTRAPQGMMATETAHALEPHALAMEAAAAALLRAASGATGKVAGAVRITASEVIGGEVLPAILCELRARHPALVFEVVLSNLPADLLRRDADIAVRMLRPKQSALVAKKAGDVALGLFAHPDYLAQYGRPKTPQDLSRHAIIGFDRDPAGVSALRGFGMALTRDMFTYRTDDQVAQLVAIRAGCGIGVCQVALAQRTPKLIRLFPRQFAFSLETWVTMHEDLRADLRIRTVFDHLAVSLAAYVREGQ